MRDAYATHLGASLLAPPLPFEINLGPPRVVGEWERGTMHGQEEVVAEVPAWEAVGPWEVVGLALVGRGLEMGRFGHVFERPSHVEGGLSR